MSGIEGERRSAPHVARTAGPIAQVLTEVLPPAGLVLEIASGSGEHALHFAREFPHLLWQPTDADAVALRSVDAWRSAEGAPNLLAPVHLDAASDSWPVDAAEAIVCINMLHISPWAATEGLMRGAERVLASGAPLYIYGAFFQQGVAPAQSNAAFDRSLKARDPAWGVRTIEDVVEVAGRHSLSFESLAPMPAENFSLLFRRY